MCQMSSIVLCAVGEQKTNKTKKEAVDMVCPYRGINRENANSTREFYVAACD